MKRQSMAAGSGDGDGGQGLDLVVVVASMGVELEGVFRNVVSFL